MTVCEKRKGGRREKKSNVRAPELNRVDTSSVFNMRADRRDSGEKKEVKKRKERKRRVC